MKELYFKIYVLGCMMAICWMLFVSTGIIIARYYKYLLPKKDMCGMKCWFAIHRPLMILASLTAISAFIVILSFMEWTWIEIDEPIQFSHSIFGIVSIGTIVIQVFLLY